MSTLQYILQIVSQELWVLSVAALPFLELRAAIPIGIALGMHPIHALILGVLGSLIPVPFLLVFIKKILIYLRRFKVFKNIVENFARKTMKKGRKVQKYSLIGLVIFVAIPLPSSGVWTGSAIAALLNIRFKYAFPAIALGTFIAGLIVLGISNNILSWF